MYWMLVRKITILSIPNDWAWKRIYFLLEGQPIRYVCILPVRKLLSSRFITGLSLYMFAVADPGFPRRGGANPRGGGANILFDQFFPKTAWKWRKFDPEGGARVPAPPLDPPMVRTSSVCTGVCSPIGYSNKWKPPFNFAEYVAATVNGQTLSRYHICDPDNMCVKTPFLVKLAHIRTSCIQGHNISNVSSHVWEI